MSKYRELLERCFKESKVLKVSVSNDSDLPVIVNPNPEELLNLSNKYNTDSEACTLRGTIDENNNVYVWEAIKAIHLEVLENLKFSVKVIFDNWDKDYEDFKFLNRGFYVKNNILYGPAITTFKDQFKKYENSGLFILEPHKMVIEPGEENDF